MEAFHSFWSLPNRCRNENEIRFPDYELLTTILSALKWKQLNGPIRMITDSLGCEYFRSIGFSDLWDGMDTALDELTGVIDPLAFWAAGKLYALKTVQTPCVMLDTDIIIWKNINGLLLTDAVAAHAEALNPLTYPEPSVFHFRNGYAFPKMWDFSLYAANTAFLYIRDSEFRDCYVNDAFRFMRNLETDGLNPVQSMCFAEQRILPMCAAANDKSLSFLMKPQEVFSQNYVTHTWGFKQVFEKNDAVREAFCIRCVRRILQEYPEESDALRSCPELSRYIEIT